MRLEIIVVVIILIFAGLFLYVSGNTDAEFGGADGEAESVIEELTGGTYEPIAGPLWEPPSGGDREPPLRASDSAWSAHNRLLLWILPPQEPFRLNVVLVCETCWTTMRW